MTGKRTTVTVGGDLLPVCSRERFTLIEAQEEDRKRNPKAKGPATYACQRCGKWHVLPRWPSDDELVQQIKKDLKIK